MKRRDFLSQLGIATTVSTFPGLTNVSICNESKGKQPPNIVFFYIDDLGWSDVSYNGSIYYHTPNIDRLSREGMVFTDAYANGPVCAPTRACLLSGQYSPRHGVYTVWKSDRKPNNKRKLIPTPNTTTLSPENLTFMEALKPAGYKSISIGKWHLGNDPKAGPVAQGFDINIGGNSSGSPNGGYFPPYKNTDIMDGPEGEYLTDRLTDEALQFIEANKDNPFFLYLTHYAVHTPIQAKEGIVKKYHDKSPSRGQDNPTYAAMIESVDESVGRILDKLDELGLSKNTVIIFSSDNGGHGCITSNQPLRGSKGMLYEGGIRVPTIICWPGKVKPGSVCHTPIMSIDLYPTFLDIAGLVKPGGKVLDGYSLMPLLTQTGTLDRESLYWHFPAYLQRYGCMDGFWRTTPVGVIRKGDWKLLEFFAPEGEENRLELYNLKNDISETTNCVEQSPHKVKELLGDMRGWRKSINAPVPSKPNPLYDPDAPHDGFDWL